MAKGNEMENGARRIPNKGSKIEAKEQIQQSKKANKNKKKINKSNNSTSSNGKGVDEVEPEDVVMVPDSENDAEDDIVVQEEDGDDVEEEEASRDGNGGGKEKEEEVTKKKKMEKKRNKDGKRKTSEGDDDSSSSSLCFPMNRISRIIKSEDADIRITQDSVFLINKATEKFLELFCKEAYACAVPDSKKQVWYKHLSSVVSKRKRFDFLLDIVPEKVKAEDALAEMSVGET
ncbi:hypothetical protein Vadar_004957 [Vaccinium darrowii]|uniref:Uncharacterized protein n=1 Tax=Vaccinium darrowii TaxID=229202 RepID=A0ACB7Z931_9ERIC|nr:hypothetical protein Vadar_004957 [Vaccinium darrowii]